MKLTTADHMYVHKRKCGHSMTISFEGKEGQVNRVPSVASKIENPQNNQTCPKPQEYAEAPSVVDDATYESDATEAEVASMGRSSQRIRNVTTRADQPNPSFNETKNITSGPAEMEVATMRRSSRLSQPLRSQDAVTECKDHSPIGVIKSASFTAMEASSNATGLKASSLKSQRKCRNIGSTDMQCREPPVYENLTSTNSPTLQAASTSTSSSLSDTNSKEVKTEFRVGIKTELLGDAILPRPRAPKRLLESAVTTGSIDADRVAHSTIPQTDQGSVIKRQRSSVVENPQSDSNQSDSLTQLLLLQLLRQSLQGTTTSTPFGKVDDAGVGNLPPSAIANCGKYFENRSDDEKIKVKEKSNAHTEDVTQEDYAQMEISLPKSLESISSSAKPFNPINHKDRADSKDNSQHKRKGLTTSWTKSLTSIRHKKGPVEGGNKEGTKPSETLKRRDIMGGANILTTDLKLTSTAEEICVDIDDNDDDDGDDDESTIQSKNNSRAVQRHVPNVVSCCICQEKFVNGDDDEYRQHLMAHVESFEDKSVCHLCRIDFSTHDKMIDHFMTLHGSVDKLVCPYPSCPRSFRTKRTLQLHANKHRN